MRWSVGARAVLTGLLVTSMLAGWSTVVVALIAAAVVAATPG